MPASSSLSLSPLSGRPCIGLRIGLAPSGRLPGHRTLSGTGLGVLAWSLWALFVVVQSGCSIRTYALCGAADALSGTSGGLGTDDDPVLVRDAAPFGLKTMESLAASLPDHRPIRLALASGFAQYSYAFVNQDADRAEDKDIAQARVLWKRARRLYLRARNYALAGLDIAHPGSRAALLGGDRAGWQAALGKMVAADVPYLYWCAASWGLAVSTAKDDANLIGDLPAVDMIMQRAMALQPDYDEGAIYEFYVSFDAARSKQQGGGPERAKQDLEQAQKLGKGYKLGSIVSYAEGVLISEQKKSEFVQLLRKVVETDVYSEEPAWKQQRLANIIAQQRAQWLLSRLSDLFAE
ncbi:MAG TPA: TRAP transporter TatT component family protein [Pseudomonadota bacterium]|nr:TRAP transporter TatT component family protein [Pseudomonadota bacterium]